MLWSEAAAPSVGLLLLWHGWEVEVVAGPDSNTMRRRTDVCLFVGFSAAFTERWQWLFFCFVTHLCFCTFWKDSEIKRPWKPTPVLYPWSTIRSKVFQRSWGHPFMMSHRAHWRPQPLVRCRLFFLNWKRSVLQGWATMGWKIWVPRMGGVFLWTYLKRKKYAGKMLIKLEKNY